MLDPVPCPYQISQRPHSETPLESLLGDLRLRRLDRGVRIRVHETASQLPVLLRRRDAGAHAHALPVVGAARDGLVAVGVGDATPRDELLALAVADVGGAGVIGGHLRERGCGDCEWTWGSAFRYGIFSGLVIWQWTYGRGAQRQ